MRKCPAGHGGASGNSKNEDADPKAAAAAPQSPPMTRAEREELRKLIGTHMKLAKSLAEQRAAEQMADAEQKLAARYDFCDQAWRDLTAAADSAVKKADAELADRCRALGIPESFRPELHVMWYSRGENAAQESRAELRKVAQTRFEANRRQALTEIERGLLEVTTRLVASALSSDDARAIMAAIPSVDQLMPLLEVDALEQQRVLPGHER